MTATTDSRHLHRAIELASKARERGNGPFGAVLVSAEGTVLGEAENQTHTEADFSAHAETLVLRNAARQYGLDALVGCTLYASGEPCAMCAGTILYVGIGRLVFGLGLGRQTELRSRPTRRRQVPCRHILAIAHDPVDVVGPLLEAEAELPFLRPSTERSL